MSLGDMFSKGIKREKVGRPGKSKPEQREAYDQGKAASKRRELDARQAAAEADAPQVRTFGGLKRQRVGRK